MGAMLGANIVTQVAIIVKDIEVTKTKYAEFFGIEPPPTIGAGEYETTKTQYMGKPAPEASCKMAFFSVGPNVMLELIEPNGEASTWQDFLDQKGEGIHHIAFNVKGMDDVLAKTEKQGMPTVQQGLYGDASGRYAYIDATADLKCAIELLENF